MKGIERMYLKWTKGGKVGRRQGRAGLQKNQTMYTLALHLGEGVLLSNRQEQRRAKNKTVFAVNGLYSEALL